MIRTLSIVAIFVGFGMSWAGAGPAWLFVGAGGLAVACLVHAQPHPTPGEQAEALGRASQVGRDVLGRQPKRLRWSAWVPPALRRLNRRRRALGGRP